MSQGTAAGGKAVVASERLCQPGEAASSGSKTETHKTSRKQKQSPESDFPLIS